MAEKHCTVCGAKFHAPPSSKTVTCSKGCSSKHRSRAHRGVRNRWSDEARARLSARGQTANLRKGTDAARRAEKSGPYETNVSARDWIITSPTGEIYTARNLRLWCEMHSHLFDPHPWRHAYAGLKQAVAYLRGSTARRVGSYKGWRVTQPGLPEAGQHELRGLAAEIEKIAKEKLG